jgi:hypothetical protein
MPLRRASATPAAMPMPMPASRGPQHVHQHPAQAEFAQVVQAQQAQAEDDEGKGAAVVHARFAGQVEAQLVAVAGVAGLHIGGQHRVGGRQDRAQQDSRAQRQTQHEVGEERHQPHRDAHRQCRQQDRRAPADPKLTGTGILTPAENSEISTATSVSTSSSAASFSGLK